MEELENIGKAIKEEINWHEDHLGTSQESTEFERGFLMGLRQALFLIVLYKKLINQNK